MNCPYIRRQANESTRRFRIWDAREKKHCPGRNYAHERRALDGALLLVRWGQIGTTLEVYDIVSGKLIGQYVRKPTTIWFRGER